MEKEIIIAIKIEVNDNDQSLCSSHCPYLSFSPYARCDLFVADLHAIFFRPQNGPHKFSGLERCGKCINGEIK